VHGRFVVPVLLVGGKSICRSSTLSRSVESLYNGADPTTQNVDKT
jgi:hypothetical protein